KIAGVANTKHFNPTNPAYNPEIPPAIIQAYNGFLYFKVTPYIAGSVTPARNAETAEAPATCFKSLFFDFY
ncbi:MAG: hypothetical protein UCH84_07610, partial [Eubacterium sp.]|nr:hypothetical protein [Eubacterium sp.]